MLIRRLVSRDTAAFRALRLEALLRHPEAFGDSHAEAAARAPSTFESLITQAPPAAILGAFDGGVGPDAEVLRGMVGLAVPGHAKQHHKGLIWGVYVEPAARGRGIGLALLSATLQAARTNGLERLNLSVAADSAAAMAVYAAMGFRPYGRERQALRLGPGHYQDEVLLALDLQA